MREYASISKKEYFDLTQFGKEPNLILLGHDAIDEIEKIKGEFWLIKFEISEQLACKVLSYVHANELCTRGDVAIALSASPRKFPETIYTINFAFHIIPGTYKTWYVLSTGGREPTLESEFISYGPKRAGGSRKHRYRRNLSYSEKNQVEHLNKNTPDLKQIYLWMARKYPADILRMCYRFGSPF